MSGAGQDLHAPMVERLIELPMDISGGRINGDLRLRAHDSKTWHFPSFGGRLRYTILCCMPPGSTSPFPASLTYLVASQGLHEAGVNVTASAAAAC
jgi:hypothetical protein